MKLLVLWLLPAAQAAGFLPSPKLDFDRGPAELSKHCAQSKERALTALRAIADRPPLTVDFGSGPEALETSLWDLSDETASDVFLKYVSVSSSVRQAGLECETMLDQFGVEVFAREDLYTAVKAAVEKRERLDAEARKLIAKELLDFRRNGLELPPAKREEIKKIKLRLAELEANFGKNINDSKETLALAREELDGLPESFVNRLPREGALYKVSLDYPDYFPFMNNAKNPDARRRLEFLYNNRAAAENAPLLAEALELRRKAAALLGYQSHAHMVLEDRMAGKPAAVRKFLERLEKKLRPLAEAELKVLRALKREQEGSKSDGIIHAWDWRFYDNLLKKTRHQLDDEKIKEYFPAEPVIEEMLAVYQTLLAVEFRPVKGASLWHPDVKLYEVREPGQAEPFAFFYMDLFPREGKFKHAAAFPLIKGRRLPDGTYQRPVAAMVANFDRATKDRPSLLPHREVETLFHEFGHIMHQTLTKARYGRFSGTSVARDFVEAPSQMLENWVWNPAVLSRLSGHYQDRSQKLPDDLLKRMIAAKNVNAGLVYLRQNFFASIDLRYHEAPRIKDTTEEYARLMERISLIPMSQGTHPEASFGHLLGGYDSAYYGYLWSEVFAQDMFSRFEKEGVMNPVLGRLYREQILEPGRSRDEMDLLKSFLGREPNEDAFLKNIGLEKK